MGLLTPILPAIGQPNASEDADVLSALTAIYGLLNGSIDAANIAAAAAIADSQLASPNNAIWRPVFVPGTAPIPGGATAGTYMLRASGASKSPGDVASPTPIWTPNSADVAVAGKTTNLRLVFELAVNGTAPAVNFTLGLHRITAIATVAGSEIGYTLAAAALSVAINTPSINTAARAVSATLALSSLTAGAYLLAVTLSGTAVVNSMAGVTSRLEMQHA